MTAEIPISNEDRTSGLTNPADTTNNSLEQSHPATNSIERYRQEATFFREMLESGDPIEEARAQERLRLLRIMTSNIHRTEVQSPDADKIVSSDPELNYPIKPEEKSALDKAIARTVGLFRFLPDEAARILHDLRDPDKRDKAIKQLDKLEAIRVKENE